MVLVCLGCVLLIVVGVFGAEMAVSFRSSGEGPNAGIFGQFQTAHILFGDCKTVRVDWLD